MEYRGTVFQRPVRVPVKIHVFHFNKSCFQLEVALSSGSRRSQNLGQHCQILIYNNVLSLHLTEVDMANCSL